MTQRDLINDLVERLRDAREPFLTKLDASIASHIESQGRACLTLIERAPGAATTPDTTWELKPTPAYAKRLIAFSRGKAHDNNQLESALTEPIIQLVTDAFHALYQAHEDGIAASVVEHVINDAPTLDAVVVAVLEAPELATPPGADKDRVLAIISAQLAEAVRQSGAASLTAALGKSVGASLTQPIATHLATALAKAIAIASKSAIAKLLASTAIKATIGTTVKKLVAAALTSAITKAIAAKFGVSAAAIFAWVLIPVIAAYITYEVTAFPKKLGERVAHAVTAQLREQFDELNRTVLEQIVREVVTTSAAAIAHEAAQDPDTRSAVQRLLKAHLDPDEERESI